MSRIMFVMFEGGGNVPVQLAIAKRLVARGHQAHVLGDEPIRGPAIAAGCTFATFPSAPAHNFRDREADRVRDWSVANPLKQLARIASELVFGPAERYARDVLAELERRPMDALAIDCLLFGAMIGAERSGLPTAQLHHMPYSWPTPGVPPFGLGLHPARGVLGRLRDRMLGGITRHTFERNGLPPVNAARVALGMPPLASVFDQVHRQDRVLVLTSKRFDFAGRVELPENVVHVGPQLDDPAWVAPWTSPWADDDARPLVVVALGSTFQNQGAVTQRVIDALGTLPVRGLVTLGGVLAPSDFALPANVVAVASAPHHTVLPLARAVVAHGGHGTVMKALSRGKPLVCIPLGRDQADNAARVQVAGAGLRASAKASVSTLRTAIAGVVDSAEYAAGAQRMAGDIARDVAEDRAVTELEGLTRSPARRLPMLATLVALLLFLALGCGDRTPGSQMTDAGVDAGADAAPDATTIPTIADIQCGPTPPIGPGNVAEFQKHIIDTGAFPDALCNDGTPAIIYFRPHNGAGNRTKWVFNLHGGGVCSGGESCLARWCGCNNTTECPYTTKPTNFSRLTMTNVSPAQKAADGVFLRGGTGVQTNPYGDYNQVEFSYCSSDAWRGTRRAVELKGVHPKTGVPVTFTTHFLGARVLEANFATLRRNGVPALVYTRAGANTPMPDMDEATEVIVTGDSAGGSGVITHLDSIAQSLRAVNANVSVYGLLDANVGPDWSRLDFGTYVNAAVRSYDQFLSQSAPANAAIGAVTDTSCTAFHSADPRPCGDDSHVIRHHVTTPFFVRMALRDMLIAENYTGSMVRNPDLSPMTVMSFALTLHAELTQFASMLSPGSAAEERASMTVAPGVFAPGCTKHDTIHTTLQTYGTTITPPGGSPLRLLQVFDNWKTGGTPTNILTQSTTLADTVCP